MSSVARFMRKVELVGQARKQVIKSAFLNHACVEVLFRNREVSSCWIADHCHTEAFIGSTEFILVKPAAIVEAKDTVTVMVEQFWACFSSWIYVRIELVAVSSTPVISSEGGNIRVSVIVHVENWEMAVSEAINKDVNKPFPWGRNGESSCRWQAVLFWLCFNDPALFVLAKSKCKAGFVWRSLIDECLNDNWTSKMNESFASWL